MHLRLSDVVPTQTTNHFSQKIVFIVISKIIRALEIIRVIKLISNAVYEINICQVLYTVCNKHEMIKISNQTIEKNRK